MKPEYSGTLILDVMERAGKNYNRYLTEAILKHGSGVQEMLDFGAGSGTFAKQLRQRNISVLCVEPDEYLRKALLRAGFKAVERIDRFPLASFDFSYALNVLEHIENDLEAIAAIKSRMKPGGKVLIFVPAFKLLYSAFDRKVGHVRRYTVRSLASVVQHAGMNVKFSNYADSLGFLIALAYRFLGDKEGNLDAGPLRIYDSLFFPVSRLLDRAFSRLFGKNVMLLAERPLK